MNITKDSREAIKARGHYKATICDPSRAGSAYENVLKFLKENPFEWLIGDEAKRRHGEIYRELVRAYERLAVVQVLEYENLVPTDGLNVLARRLANDTTYSGIVNYAALGSGIATPALGDTQLGTEVYRKTIDSSTFVNNIAYLSCFIPQGTATGTHNEGGLFIDGTGSANTGKIFSHVLFTPAITKGALNSLTLDVTITLT